MTKLAQTRMILYTKAYAKDCRLWGKAVGKGGPKCSAIHKQAVLVQYVTRIVSVHTW